MTEVRSVDPSVPEVAWLVAALRSRHASPIPPEPPAATFSWDLLFETARRNGVLQLLGPAMDALPLESVPGAARLGFETEVRDLGIWNLELTGELVRVLDLLDSHGVRALPYKGPVLAQVAYGDLSLRSFTDLDVLLDADRVPDAIEILERDGYVAGWPWTHGQLRHLLRHGHDFALVKDERFGVELQWAIGSRPHVVPRSVSALLDRAGSVRLAGRDVPTLDPTDQVVVLAIHGSIHLWSRLAWVCDFVEACTNVPGVDLAAALRLANGVRSRRMLLLAAAMAERILAVQVDEELAQLAAADENVVALVETLVPALLVPGRPDLRAAEARVGSRVRLADRRRDGVIGASRAAFTPNQSDWQSVPMPDGLFALYYPIRVARLLAFLLGIGRDREGSDVFNVH